MGKHLQLDTRGLLAPDELVKTEHCSCAVIQESSQKDEDCVESEADFSTGHHFVDAVVEQSDHVEYRHECSADAGDHGTIVDEVQKSKILIIVAGISGEYGFSAVGDDEYSQIVHLCGDAEGVDQFFDGTFMFWH